MNAIIAIIYKTKKVINKQMDVFDKQFASLNVCRILDSIIIIILPII